MPKNRRWMAARLEPSMAHRRVRWLRRCALIGGLVLVVKLVISSDFETWGSGATASAVPYHEGPVDSRPVRVPELPAGAEELLGLAALAAFLYGLRVSELGRTSRDAQRAR